MEVDPFLQSFDSSDLQIAKEFLTNWLPFLTKDLCEGCAASLLDRIQSLSPGAGIRFCSIFDFFLLFYSLSFPSPLTGYESRFCAVDEQRRYDPGEEEVDGGGEESGLGAGEERSSMAVGADEFCRASTDGWEHIKATGWDTDPATESPKVRMSWADELEEEEEEEARKNSLEDEMEEGKGEMRMKKTELSREQRERIRFSSVGRKKDFVCLERIDGKIVNILEGIELHTGVFSAAEQKKIVNFVYELEMKGRNYELDGKNTSPKSKHIPKNLIPEIICAKQVPQSNLDKQNENPSGILRNSTANPIPNIFKLMIKRLIGWHVMPVSCVPDSCSVNIYEPGYSVQPNIESHDFVRPFCTVSFLSECNMVFGFNLQVADAGEVKGSAPIPLPVGSVIVLNGNGANIAKHWVPAAPSKRISITFRKMAENKRPLGFRLEPDLQNIQPYDLGSATESQTENKEKESFVEIRTMGRGKKFNGRSNGPRGRRNFRNDGASASVFDRITPAKKLSHSSADADFTRNHSTAERARNSKSFFAPEYEADLQDHPDETEELQERVHHGWMNEEGGHYDRNKFSNDRSVRMEQKRIIITRNIDREDDSFSRRSPEFNPVHAPQVRIRTLKNHQRRVRMNQ
ncbi:alkylated DNA repair protein alkB 5 [Dendrobium catenatum]|uniref:Alkylated DNA repair protein alkB 5 n=1 Tax=Dendrobium catenatum TaxID=906689 RepID=A0A2I0VR98_9ASPA|nr:alkylated DNA repair protein alkB 5 [Dendrobium catenatum]